MLKKISHVSSNAPFIYSLTPASPASPASPTHLHIPFPLLTPFLLTQLANQHGTTDTGYQDPPLNKNIWKTLLNCQCQAKIANRKEYSIKHTSV